MPDVPLSLAISYYDHVSDLVRGRVRAEGISLTSIELPHEEIFFRMVSFSEWDVAEFSMAKYVSLAGAGDPPFRAIPVFPSRVFRQSAIYVATRAGIANPGDLAGRSVGVPEWAQTAGIYARAYLQHQCGVRLRDIHWIQAGVNEPGRDEKVRLLMPDGVEIERIRDRSLTEMLQTGELDAIISARPPDAFIAGDKRIAPLWADPRSIEEEYYRKTNIFPIMHVIVIKSATLDRYPWIAMNLFKAFQDAKKNSLDRLANPVISRMPFAWAPEAVLAAQSLFGTDCWPYGVESNRPTLEAFLQYSWEQGLTERNVQVDQLFPRELSKFVRV
ncbi:MAG: 4,5-dihydroxyphthalate decarboxylase [Terriglobia bacterium]